MKIFGHYVKFFLCVFAAVLLSGCASLHHSPGQALSGEESLVFGRIVLVRDGAEDVISTFSTSVKLFGLESTAEPLIVVEPFEQEGRFRWRLRPGTYVLAITLSAVTDDIFSCAFTVPSGGRAFYFGDVFLRGRKYFNTIGGANIRDVKADFQDHPARESAELLRRFPGFDAAGIGSLAVSDISGEDGRLEFFCQRLEAAPLCATRLDELAYEALPAGKAASFEIPAAQGTFAFPEGRSYFRAFALPRNARSVSLVSQPFSGGVPDRFRVFAPAALILDEKYNVLADLGSGFAAPVPASLFPPHPARLTGSIDLDGLEQRPAFLVVYTTDRLMGRTRYASRPGVITIPGGAVPSGLGVPVGLDPWLVGRITLEVSTR